MGYKYQKQVLRQRYGNRCMLCERVLQKKKQSFHHRQPRACGGRGTIENGVILCAECQHILHQFEYGTEPYAKLDALIEKNMKKYRK